MITLAPRGESCGLPPCVWLPHSSTTLNLPTTLLRTRHTTAIAIFLSLQQTTKGRGHCNNTEAPLSLSSHG